MRQFLLISLLPYALSLKTEQTGTRAASQQVNCYCQCSSTTFRDKYGKIQGNCKSTDHTGAQWCYVDPRYSQCNDLGHSKRFNQQWSYQACATPALNSYQCRGGGGGGGGGYPCRGHNCGGSSGGGGGSYPCRGSNCGGGGGYGSGSSSGCWGNNCGGSGGGYSSGNSGHSSGSNGYNSGSSGYNSGSSGYNSGSGGYNSGSSGYNSGSSSGCYGSSCGYSSGSSGGCGGGNCGGSGYSGGSSSQYSLSQILAARKKNGNRSGAVNFS